MRTRRRRITGAVLEIGVQALMLAGLPLGLWRLTGNPIPSHLPSWLDIQMWWAGVQLYPASALDILPRIVVDALWIAWGWYAAWTLLGLLWELARLPGIVIPRILLRLTPRTTVQAITAGAVATAPAVHAVPAPVHTAESTDRLPANLNGRLHLTTAPQHPRAPRPGPTLSVLNHPALHDAPVHIVVHGDTLWDLAVHYYGDGEQWRRIFAGNIGHPQPDGNQLTNPDLILPGWKLVIPHHTISAHGITATPTPPPAPTAPTPPTTPPTPHSAPTAPGVATPGPIAPHSPGNPPPVRRAAAPGGNGESTPARRGSTADPRTVGWHIPEGGYIGITLIAAIATSTALLKTRKRLHPNTTPAMPTSAEALTAVYDAAKRARALGHVPPSHQGQLPPLCKPQPGIPMVGTHPRATQEAWYDPGLQTGPLVVTGPGAEDTVRALVLSMLGASDLDLDLQPGASPIGWELVLTDQALARDLFGATPDQHLPGWLHLTDTPAAAVTTFHVASRRRAALGIGAEDFIASDDEPLTMLITRTDPDLQDTIVDACLADPTASLGAILLGDAPTTEHTTTLTIDQDHTTTTATGPRARELQGLHLYHTTRDLAEELFGVLYAAREVYRQPPLTPDPETPTHDPDEDPTVRLGTQLSYTDGGSARPGETPPKEPEPPKAPTCADDPRTFIDTPLLLRVLGPVDVLGPGTTRPARGERSLAILTALALHPHGLRTPQIINLAWNEAIADDRTQRQAVYSALRRTRDLLRAAAGESTPTRPNGDEEDYVIVGSADRYRFDADQITTDIQLQALLEQRADQATDPSDRLRLLTQAAGLYRGVLADGLDDNERDWLTTARYETVLHAARLHLSIAALATDTDAGTALNHVKQAVALAPDDEHTTTEAIRLYQQLDRPDLARALARRRAT